jgi:SAM-dependent methyltransferase
MKKRGSAPYDPRFYRALDATAEPSATAVVPLVLKWLSCRSVVDLGCGDGGWLAAFIEAGVCDVLGLDGPWVKREFLKITPDRFMGVDLSAPLRLNRRFDLALSVEVAEHLPAACAETFVDNLVTLSPVVLFSAAVPGQGGVHHVNEQWPDYWAEIFKKRGYRALDLLRPLIWSDASVAWWYRQNLLLFATERAITDNDALAAIADSPSGPLALVHPELLSITLRGARPRLGRWVRMLPDAIRRTYGRHAHSA